MRRRPATVTQADVARAIRAAQATGLTIARLVVRSDGVSIETLPDSSAHASVQHGKPPQDAPEPVGQVRDFVL